MGLDCQRSAQGGQAHGDVSSGSGGRCCTRRSAEVARTGGAGSGRNRSPSGDHVWDRPGCAVGPTRQVWGHTHGLFDAVGERARDERPLHVGREDSSFHWRTQGVDTSNSKRPGARVLSSFVFWTRRGSSDRRNASHRWATFVRNHAKAVVAADFFNVVLCQNSALLK